MLKEATSPFDFIYGTDQVVRGVGAVILNPRGEVLFVKESQNKALTRKFIGMESIPMETQEVGEDDEETLDRMINNEEIGGIEIDSNPPTTRYPLCAVQLTPRVWLHTYALSTPETELRPGAAEDVTSLRWVDLDNILNAPLYRLSLSDQEKLPDFLDPTVKLGLQRYLGDLPVGLSVDCGSLRWRPGVMESVRCFREFYFGYEFDPPAYRPQVFYSPQDKPPDELFTYL